MFACAVFITYHNFISRLFPGNNIGKRLHIFNCLTISFQNYITRIQASFINRRPDYAHLYR